MPPVDLKALENCILQKGILKHSLPSTVFLKTCSALHGVTAINDTIVCFFLFQLASGWHSGRHKSVGVIGFFIAFTPFWRTWSDFYVTTLRHSAQLSQREGEAFVRRNTQREGWKFESLKLLFWWLVKLLVASNRSYLVF